MNEVLDDVIRVKRGKKVQIIEISNGWSVRFGLVTLGVPRPKRKVKEKKSVEWQIILRMGVHEYMAVTTVSICCNSGSRSISSVKISIYYGLRNMPGLMDRPHFGYGTLKR